LLGKAIDGGEPLDPTLWHPLRSPVFHPEVTVRDVCMELKSAWDAAKQEHPVAEDDWYETQIIEVVGLFDWAQSRDEAVVSILSLPFDRERARRIVEPCLT
jgi:hypothetical protein